MKFLSRCALSVCRSAMCASESGTYSNADLLSILIAIAATSAAVIAILCGFIFSKYLPAINSRESDINRLQGLEKDIKKHEKERDDLQDANRKIFPLSFLYENVDVIMSEEKNKLKRLMDIYDRDRHGFPPDEMMDYCKKAIDVWGEYCSVDIYQISHTDPNPVPAKLRERYAGDETKLKICEALGMKFRERRYIEELFWNLYTQGDEPVSQRIRTNENEIKYHSDAARMLKEEYERLDNQIDTQKKPRFIGMGLLFFGAYGGSCVILPLVFSVIAARNGDLRYGATLELIFVILFSVFFVFTFVYLAFLMQWKPKLAREEDGGSSGFEEHR